MVFIQICRAIYDYAPQAEGELAITEGDLLFVLEKDDDDWWKAKKKAANEDEDEPEGLIPNNYVEEVAPMHKAKALYDYSRQTDEELSFTEDAMLDVYDTTDPDWTLVGIGTDYGFAPSNYIEAADAAPAKPQRPRLAEQEPESPIEQVPTPDSPAGSPTTESPAAALAGILAQKTGSSSRAPPPSALPPRPTQYTPDESDEEAPPPALPQRSPSVALSPRPRQVASPPPDSPSVLTSPPYRSPVVSRNIDDDEGMPHSPGGYHLYNIHEMVSHMGKNKKMPMTLGINVAKGVIMISPEKSRDGPQREWTADKLEHYSIEGKHVFMDLVRPSKSVDFHAGAKDTAQEIVGQLGELAGAARAEGLREVIAAGQGGGGQKKGKMLYEFMAQGDDEVTVAVDDEVIVLDDMKSDEWWMVRRLKNGKEGVVPSSYVEITGTTAPSSMAGLNAAKATVEQNRLEEERLARESTKQRKRSGSDAKAEVGPGMPLPERNSSLMASNVDTRRTSQRGKRDDRSASSSAAKPKPNVNKTRTWTDRSGSFKVEAEFIGLKDGKIHLHKLNGVKIAVPVTKMAIEDLEYVERVTGVSLDEDKPLSDIKRRSTQRAKEKARESASASAGASIEHPKKPEYDWFDFFLASGVNPQICERYAAQFTKDNMGEENLPDLNEKILRTLGLKEGDILRVMKHLDAKFNRSSEAKRGVSFGGAETIPDGDEGASGGLFTGPGGTLRNNTRKGRPAPAVVTGDTVDPKAFEQKADDTAKRSFPSESAGTPLASASKREPVSSGFDDDAWNVKPARQAPAPTSVSSPAAQAPAAARTAPKPPTGGLADLSLLDAPLVPTPAQPPAPQQQAQAPAAQPQQQQAASPQQSAPTGATPSLFEQLAQSQANQHHGQQQQQMQPQPTGFNQQQPNGVQQPQQTGFQEQQPSGFNQPQQPGFMQQQPTGFQQPQQTGFQQNAPPRQRPQAPQISQLSGAAIAPPPQRAASAPQNQLGFQPPPLQPQLTGYQQQPHLQAQISPSGQSLQDLQNQQRFQQQQQQYGLQPQPTGFGQQNGFNQFQNGLQPQPTGFQQFPQQQMPQPTGFNQFQQQPTFAQPNGSPFADPPRAPFQPQPTGFTQSFSPSSQLPPQATGINSFLPPALQPQPTGFQNQQFGGFGQQPPTVPPIPQQPTIAPLQPQKTGPAPPVRFGTQPANKLTPQPTGRRANLQHATAQNPFGF